MSGLPPSRCCASGGREPEASALEALGEVVDPGVLRIDPRCLAQSLLRFTRLARGESPLAELRLAPSEASLIDNDLRNFPGMDAEPQREDIVRFTDREHTLDVMNVNDTGIESATGVDLIYYIHE